MKRAVRRTRDSGGQAPATMNRYVEPIEQLVTEIVVRDIRRSTAFYRRLGFSLLRDAGDFVELTWEDHRLYLAEASALLLLEG